MTLLQLGGCRSEPLGSYLKALGLLRLVAEQADPLATGAWRGDEFFLGSRLAQHELLDFFVDRYEPTPLVAPWNGRSGFRTDAQRPSEELLRELESSDDPRLARFRRTIEAARGVYSRATAEGWHPQKQKDLWVEVCRATFPDESVRWLDAVVVLTDDRPRFPPLLGGSGGVLGSMDLSSNFMTHLVTLLRLRSGRRALTRDDVSALALSSLFGDGAPPLVSASAGQFDPGGAGGVNSSPLGSADALVNPWDFVLLLEGSVVFASGVARRLGSTSGGTAAMPFTVEASPVGFVSGANGEKGRGEVWAPLWSRPADANELGRLMAEGRSAWGRAQARSGLDFARAAASLGVDRGIDEFVRHVVVERLGQSNLAVPVGRFKVQAKREVPVLAELDSWVNTIRHAKSLPAGVVRALRRLDQAQFEVALRGGPRGLQEALVAAAGLEATVARSSGLRSERVSRPLQGLHAAHWITSLDDGSPEFRIAVAVASQVDPLPRSGTVWSPFDRRSTSPALFLRPVRWGDHRRLEWSLPARVAGSQARPSLAALGEVLALRAVAVAGRLDPQENESAGQVGVQPAFRFGIPAPLADVADLVDGLLDEKRFGRLLTGLLLLDWRHRREELDTSGWPRSTRLVRPPRPLWALLAPFFHPRALHSLNGEAGPHLRAHAGWPHLLLARRTEELAAQGLLRLRVARLDPAPVRLSVGAESAGFIERLTAALLIPLSTEGATRLMRHVVPASLDPTSPPEKETPHA